MWRQFTINADICQQVRIIHRIKDWILDLEQRGVIDGFAFNHYFGQNDDHLAVRFECSDKQLEDVKKEFRDVLTKLGYTNEPKVSSWGGDRNILQAYELGARCAFFIWDLIDKGRIPSEYLQDFIGDEFKQTSLQFQQHFNHGLMNSLMIRKYPNEQILHLMALFEWTESHDIHELYEKMQQDKILGSLRLSTD